MGRIIKFKDRVEIRIRVEEALFEPFVASRDVVCTLGMYVRKIAEMKADKLGVALPIGIRRTEFDTKTDEFVITFLSSSTEKGLDKLVRK